MRAIQVTCPHCGARLNAGEGEAVTCEYCGTASRIQRRTRMLERVLPPPTSANLPQRIAVQRRSPLAVVIIGLAVILPLAITGFVIWKVVDTTRHAFDAVGSTKKTVAGAMKSSSAGGPAGYVPPEKRPPAWQGTGTAIITDVNADGTPDILGRGRQVNAGDIVRVLALDGTTGKTLWQSEPVGTYSETYRSPLALAGDLLVFATDSGTVHAFAVKTGALAWKTTLPERVKEFCSGEAAEIVALGADHMQRPLARADGALGPATRVLRNATCPALPSDAQPHARARHTEIETALARKLGVSAAGAFVASRGGRVLGVAKATGTRVTTLVALDDKNNERWRAAVSKDPLAAEGAPEHLAISDTAVCASFSERGNSRVACFSLADGARLWDGPAPSFLSGLVAGGSSLIIGSHRGLYVHDITTGTLRWRLE